MSKEEIDSIFEFLDKHIAHKFGLRLVWSGGNILAYHKESKKMFAQFYPNAVLKYIKYLENRANEFEKILINETNKEVDND